MAKKIEGKKPTTAGKKDELKTETTEDVKNRLMNTVNLAYKDEVIRVGSDIKMVKSRTGIFAIDIKIGGYTRGRWHILVGAASSTKSTTMYIGAGIAQRICGTCLEGHITEKNFKKVVVDPAAVISKKYYANHQKKNIYCPNQKFHHKKPFYALEYDIECSHCSEPSYSLFFLVDSEHNYTREWATKFGVVHNNVILFNPEHSQQVGDVMREALNTGRVTFVGVDSVDAIGGKEESEKSLEDYQQGLQARIWNKIVRVLTSRLNSRFDFVYRDKEGKMVEVRKQAEPILVVIQQWREKIGAYGDSRVMGGGGGLKYGSSTTIDFTAGEKVWISQEKRLIEGIWINFTILKNKTGKPWQYGKFFYSILKDDIINNLSVVHVSVELGIVKQAGAWYSYKNDRFQGADKFAKALDERPDLAASLMEQCFTKVEQSAT
jgi:recombination protein RecA